MPTLNQCYGAKTPSSNEAIAEALFAAHRYRNTLCELELAKRERHELLLQRLAPEYVQCCQAVDNLESEFATLRKHIQAERVRQRTKRPAGVASVIARVAELKQELKTARSARKASKQAAYEDPAVAAAMAENAAQHKDDCKLAKQESGLYWGTEALVSQSCRSFASGGPPKFRCYDGTGQLAVQLQGGLDCREAARPNTLFYFGEWIDKRQRKCYIRIGSDNGRPVFACVPIVFHRPLPDGRIKWAYLERRKIADQARWKIRLTIDVEARQPSQVPGEVAIHTGWHMQPNGLRVCTWLGSDGHSGSLILPQSHCDDYYKLDSIRSERDTAFSDMRDRTKHWIKQLKGAPDWLEQAGKQMHNWRSPHRLAKLWWQWKSDRFDGDAEWFDAVNEWRKHDKHRWQHACRLSARIARRRKHIFRTFAHQLSEQYGVAFMSPIDAKNLTKNSLPEDLEHDNHTAHRHARWAAVSQLTAIICEQFHLRCVAVSSVNVTREHTTTGEIGVLAANRRVHWSDGTSRDVDENAVANTFARGKAAVKSGALLELEAAAKDKALAAREKLAKMQAANRAARERRRKVAHSKEM